MNEKENDFLSILVRNNFFLYSSKIKRMRRNAKEKQFLVNSKTN